MVFGSKKSNDDSKILQIIRTWYFKNGKSVNEIMMELKEKMGLSDETIREFLLRAGILNLPQPTNNTTKTSATEALRMAPPNPAFGSPTEAVSDLTVGKVKSMIDSAVSDLQNLMEKRFKSVEESIKDLNKKIIDLASRQDELEKSIKELNDKLDDRSISSIVKKLRTQINSIEEQIDTIKMLMSENYSILKSLKGGSEETTEIPSLETNKEKKEEEAPKVDIKYDEIVNELLGKEEETKEEPEEKKEEPNSEKEEDIKNEIDSVLDMLKKE